MSQTGIPPEVSLRLKHLNTHTVFNGWEAITRRNANRVRKGLISKANIQHPNMRRSLG